MQFQYDFWEPLDPTQLRNGMAKHAKSSHNSPRGRVLEVFPSSDTIEDICM